jgi:hypothetical protein
MLHVVTVADRLIYFQLLSPHWFFIKYLSSQPPRHFLGGCAVLEGTRHWNCFGMRTSKSAYLVICGASHD